MTSTFDVKQRQSWKETFNNVVALYYLLRANSTALRVKQAVCHEGEVAPQAIDFVIDVEIKVKRALGQPFYELFQRAVANEQLEILPEYMRQNLGKIFQEYRLGEDGPYAKVYFLAKQRQERRKQRLSEGDETTNDTGNGTEPSASINGDATDDLNSGL